ncbi:MAG: hypothetical protein V4561_12610 [Bacteroidota bacterium]
MALLMLGLQKGQESEIPATGNATITRLKPKPAPDGSEYPAEAFLTGPRGGVVADSWTPKALSPDKSRAQPKF